jgi:hypothetical protein
MRFQIDPHADKLPDDQTRLSFDEVKSILKGAQPICESIQDNDMERWMLTRGGQFLRQTGVDGSRYYIVPSAEAHDFLSGVASEEVIEAVSETLTRHGIEFARGPALAR